MARGNKQTHSESFAMSLVSETLCVMLSTLITDMLTDVVVSWAK
jgi:hypothetical protein